jgi:hypothetical protein
LVWEGSGSGPDSGGRTGRAHASKRRAQPRETRRGRRRAADAPVPGPRVGPGARSSSSSSSPRVGSGSVFRHAGACARAFRPFFYRRRGQNVRRKGCPRRTRATARAIRHATAQLGMAMGNSPSGNGSPSPSPRVEIFPAPVPVNSVGEKFCPTPVPARGIIPAGSPSPPEKSSYHDSSSSRSVTQHKHQLNKRRFLMFSCQLPRNINNLHPTKHTGEKGRRDHELK